jgi:RNA recognition motif-containing protein
MTEKLFIFGLKGKAWNITRIRDAFVPFGPIQDVALAKEGTAFVTFKFLSDAEEAVANMNGAQLEDSFIQVSFAKQPHQQSTEIKSNLRHAVWGELDTRLSNDGGQ